mgnify:CR=1 FL=1
MKIQKRQLPAGVEKDIQNVVAKLEKLTADIEYIALCDHPEIFEEEETENEQIL